MTPTEETDLKAIIAQLKSYIDIDDTYGDLILSAYEGDAQSAYALASMVDNALSLQLRDTDIYTGASFLNIVNMKLHSDHPHDLNPVFWQAMQVLSLDLPGALVMLMDYETPFPEEQSTIDSAVECLQRVLVMRKSEAQTRS